MRIGENYKKTKTKQNKLGEKQAKWHKLSRNQFSALKERREKLMTVERNYPIGALQIKVC